MKKNLFIKSLWQQTPSFVLLSVFIFFAYASYEFPQKDAKRDKETGVVTETRENDWGNTVTTRGDVDPIGLWFGVVTRTYKNLLGFTVIEATEYKVGMRHGKSLTNTYGPGGTLLSSKERCYYYGLTIPCETKAAQISSGGLSAFDILEKNYPWYLIPFTIAGFENEIIQAYLDTIELRLFKRNFDISNYDDNYQSVLDGLAGSDFDSVYYVHNNEAFYLGFYNLKMAEFRKAVAESYIKGENNTFNRVKTIYPGFLRSLNSLYISDSIFQIFCTDFDSLMMSRGPLVTEDPLYDSIDVRMLDALVYLISGEEESSLVTETLKSKVLQANVKSINSIRKLIRPVLEELRTDTLSGAVATYVLYSMAPNFYNGDKIRQAVRDAYSVQKGIITSPVLATDFIGNVSETSVLLQGKVFQDGGAEVTERGITWATYYNPTAEDNLEPFGAGLGEYTITLNGLSLGTTYYARSYATNSAGTSYGNCIQFTAGTTWIEEITNPGIDLKIFPNPTSGLTTFRFNLVSSENMKLIIINTNGQVVLQSDLGHFPQGYNQTQLNLENLENGIYFGSLSNGGEKEIFRKFLVAH